MSGLCMHERVRGAQAAAMGYMGFWGLNESPFLIASKPRFLSIYGDNHSSSTASATASLPLSVIASYTAVSLQRHGRMPHRAQTP